MALWRDINLRIDEGFSLIRVFDRRDLNIKVVLQASEKESGVIGFSHVVQRWAGASLNGCFCAG